MLNPAQIKLIETVSHIADEKGIGFLLIGALARNIFLAENQDVPLPRLTLDIDVACMVKNWEEYRDLLQYLIDHGDFRQASDCCHRLIFREEAIPLDVIPFGGIEDANGEISWPPDFDQTMNVCGFKTALHSALLCPVGEAMVRIIAPPIFALLKLSSFLDDNSRTKDLKDFYFLAQNYFDIIDAEKRVYTTAAPDADILSDDDFDYTVASAKLIGRDCARIDQSLSRTIAERITADLDDRVTLGLIQSCNLNFAMSKKLLTGFISGIADIAAR